MQVPVILKPAVKDALNRFTYAKAWHIDNQADLLERYQEACQLIDPALIMVQELIPGGGKSQFSYGALCQEGRPIASVVARRTRQYPVDFGRSSSYVELIEEPEVELVARRLIEDMGYIGLIEAEFKRDRRDGKLKLLDLNPRVWGWHTLSIGAGVDFLLSLLASRTKTAYSRSSRRYRVLDGCGWLQIYRQSWPSCGLAV